MRLRLALPFLPSLVLVGCAGVTPEADTEASRIDALVSEYVQRDLFSGNVLVARGDEVFELYRAPIDGHAPAQKVNGPHVTGGDVQDASMQQDFRYGAGHQVFFRADAAMDDDFELFAPTRPRRLDLERPRGFLPAAPSPRC